MQPSYIVEKYPLGWLLCSAPTMSGVPADALRECVKMFPKDAIVDSGIIHHFRATGKYDAIMCISTVKNSKQWRHEIMKSLMALPRQEQWWKGVDVGTSSAAIFAVLCDDKRLSREAIDFGNRSVPKDADDFFRCKRLVCDYFPEWHKRLPEVAQAYPDTKWPSIVQHFDELILDTAMLSRI